MRFHTVPFLLVACACSPSQRMVAQGDRQFERCYGTDFEPSAEDPDREACWTAWLAHYTRHQPASRVDYALERIESLQERAELVPLPGLGDDSLAEPAPPPHEAPAQASHEPPPKACISACSDYQARCEHSCPEEVSECRLVCSRDAARCLGGCH